ncbi:hypothetical protein SteCoe_38329 [Stentor coeruleus]|uniref:Uncharacterized protein n=1 Tax=Stentor coeruleus TaxID=5963 RepID=A0A1R2ALG8_9CILI|nr:hypothetical protein SteCoe_38329 [Stentor coeruleus]
MHISKQSYSTINSSSKNTQVRVLCDTNLNIPDNPSNYQESFAHPSKPKKLYSINNEKNYKITNENLSPHTEPNLHLPSGAKALVLLQSATTTPEPHEIIEKPQRRLLKKPAEIQTKNLKEQIESEISSIKSSPKPTYNLYDQVYDLKYKVANMQKRLILGEDKINEKSLENYELKFTILKLHNQLEKIKQKKIEKQVEESKCKKCCVF